MSDCFSKNILQESTCKGIIFSSYFQVQQEAGTLWTDCTAVCFAFCAHSRLLKP